MGRICEATSPSMEAIIADVTALANILQLFKRRDVDVIKRPECRDVIPYTNQLLQQGLLPALLKSIKTDVNNFCNRSSATNGDASSPEGLLELVRLKADIVFFASYQSQFLENEAADLVETLRTLSNLLLTGVSSSQSPEGGIDWCPSVYSLLVVLQLAHVCALQQTTCLLSRNVDYTQPMYQQCRNIEDVIEVGNNLPQAPGSRCGMDVATINRTAACGTESGWLCDGARGFACLAFAVLRQPEVDVDHAPASDVEWFLHEACRLRAYSYIRLCMLPVLQAAYLQDRDTTLFYVAVLCELLENLAKMFCMTHYKQVHAHNENDFPYAFFPPTGTFYADNMAFYADRLSAAASGQQRPAPAPAVDSLEDVLSVYSAVLELRPEFAHAFWPSTQSRDIELQRRQQGFAQGGLSGTTEHHDIVDHYYHPFVMKAVDASFHHPELMICAIRFVAALSSSPLGRTAYAGYLFVQDSSHHRFTWDHFFESMDAIALQLGASLSASASVAAATATGAAGSYSASLSGFANQQAQQLQLSQAHFSLSEKDAEGLVAIMRLLAAVAVHPAAASLLHETHRPVPRLFALLSCALPITLKGAILKALSVFARGSATVSEEVWQLVEAHRLLPITSAPLGTSAGSVAGGSAQSFGARKAGVQGRGLRIELEEAESRAGRYPVTEGFLLLLEALLSHGVPDSTLGLGYRRPGLMVYLDYVVEEVLLRCQDRSYLPADWPSARAQRWRITALSLSVLYTILQHYPINCLPADSVAAAEELLQRNGSAAADRDTRLLKDVVADFRDQLCEYSIEGSAAPQRMSRPKSAAFVLMAQLLGRARLFDYVGYVLLECSGANIEQSFDEHCVSEIGAAVDLLQTQYQRAHPSSATAKQDNSAFDFAFPTMGTGPLKSAQRQAPQRREEPEPMDLTSLGREAHLCDPVLWQERSVAAAVGLVYECALREGKFMTLLRSAPAKLTITRVSEQGRVAVLPVVAHGLSELLCADRDSGMLSLIAQVVPTHVRSCPCLPPVNVLAVRVLEHVTLHLPASRLLAALVPAAELAIGRGFQQAGSDRAPGAGWYLMKGCADALRSGASAEEERGGGTLHYDALCMGGAAYPAFFSLSAAYTRNTAPPNLYLTMVNADSNEEAAAVDAEFLRALRLGGTIREAVLSLLLRTLTSATPTLSHQLLGLAPTAQGADAVSPEGCLDAAIHLLSPSSAPLGTTFLQQSPEQACDCFELIYRLCASPVSTAAVLRRLGDRKVDFLRSQLTLLVYLLHLSDDELLQGVDPVASSSAGGNGNGNVNPKYTALHGIKTALNNSAAWLLKTCVLFLRFAEVSGGSATTAQAQQLLELLCTGCDALPFKAERGDAVSVLEKFLHAASSFPPHPYASARPAAALQQCLEATAAIQRPSKAGTGWGDNNPFLRQDAAHADALAYPVVDLRQLSALLQASASGGGAGAAEVEEALSAAVLLNLYHKSVAAGMHFCLAWCQLVSMIAAGGKTQQILLRALGAAATEGGADCLALADIGSGDSQTQAAAARRLVDLVFEQLLLPTAAVLASGAPLPPAQSRALCDQLVRCLLSQVRLMLAPLSTEGVGAGDDPVMLLPDQYLRVLEVVTQLILQPRKSLSPLVTAPLTVGLAGRSTAVATLTAVQSALSSAQQGMLAAALVHLLRAPARLLRAEGADPVSSWSQESKSQSQRDADAEGLSEEALLALECVQGAEETLSHVGGELVDALGRDCTRQGGAVGWRLSSLAALTAVVECLAGRRDSGLRGTLGLARSAQLLVGRGHLQALLDAALAPSSYSDDNDALLLNTASLCCQLAACAEGAEALLSCGIMARLVALDHFVNPPPLPDEIAFFAAPAEGHEGGRAAAVDRLQARFGAVLGLISCLAAVAPSSQVVATGIAQFINKNQVLATQLLRLRYLTLTGLALTEGLVALLAQLAAVPTTALAGEADLLELLGPGADSLVTDVCTLLGVLGKSPLPPSLFPAASRPAPGESWWDRIQPSPAEEGNGREGYEMELRRAPGYFPAIDSLPADWSAFDARKLRLSLLLLGHCTSFLRLVTSPQRPATAQRALRAVNGAAVAEAFCQCVSTQQRLAGSGEGGAARGSTGAWLQSPQLVQAAAQDRADEGGDAELNGTLSRLTEGLICVVHNSALAGTGQLAPAAAQRAVEAAERFPPHSFTRQVARWVRDLQLK